MEKTIRMSQRHQILDALLKGDRITSLSALARFNCARLASRIHELRREGHDILTDYIPRNGKSFAEYRLA